MQKPLKDNYLINNYGDDSIIDYKKVILDWIIHKKKLNGKEEDLIKFFENGFKYTNIPNEVYFGTSKNSLCFITGNIYLIAYVHTGTEKGIWMIEDKINDQLYGNIIQKEIKSTKDNNHKLYWIHFEDVSQLKNINGNKSVWKSYERASCIIKNTRCGKYIRYDRINGKAMLTEFWNYQNDDIKSLNSLQDEFEKKVAKSRKISSLERLERLKHANKYPEKVIAKTIEYKRNPDVVAEVLKRANGKCEICGKPAPFIRKSDRTPYLEVHHKISLAEGGEDTCENAQAICPNCHRKQHYGIKNCIKKSFD